MRFLSVYSHEERNTMPCQEEMERMGKLVEEGMKAGFLLAVEGCLPSEMGARVRRKDDSFSVTDGPFLESKELIGGLAIIQADSKEHAIQIAKDFLGAAGNGVCELRQLYDGDCCSDAPTDKA